MTCLLLACSAQPGPTPNPTTPTGTPETPPAAGAEWSATYGDAGGFTGGGRSVNLWSDGSVYAREDDGLRRLVGRIPPAELAPFAAAMRAPELASLNYHKPHNMTTTLSWSSEGKILSWSWPQAAADLPAPLTAAVDALDKAQAAMQPAEDDQHFTVGSERLQVTRSQLIIPAVAGQPKTWNLEAGKHKLSLKVAANSVEELKGQTLGGILVTEVHNGIVEGTLPDGSFKTDVTLLALP